ncbi:hypothetical protein QCA50_016391 [Cerrena zonata]|uniref:Uncharacterized protein n=1 Tax=Cerrena zonata TaxID=2478898 RepID=A0AAW0FM57_9APHY
MSMRTTKPAVPITTPFLSLSRSTPPILRTRVPLCMTSSTHVESSLYTQTRVLRPDGMVIPSVLYTTDSNIVSDTLFLSANLEWPLHDSPVLLDSTLNPFSFGDFSLHSDRINTSTYYCRRCNPRAGDPA